MEITITRGLCGRSSGHLSPALGSVGRPHRLAATPREHFGGVHLASRHCTDKATRSNYRSLALSVAHNVHWWQAMVLQLTKFN